MEPISATTNRVIEGLQLSLKQNGAELLENGLKKYLTKKEQQHITYCLIKNRNIIIGVDASVWLYTLSCKKRQLLKQINRFLLSNRQIQQKPYELVFRLDTK